MIDLSYLPSAPVAVLGLGKSGLATAQALVASGIEAWAWDDQPEKRAEAEALGLKLVDLNTCDWSEPQALVLSPGIPHRFPAPHPITVAAADADCPIVSDIELLALGEPSATFIGITGTNGKSTTTALLGQILKTAGKPVEVGGNLGIAALSLAPLSEDGTYVLELSSYQLELTHSLAFDIAVLLNITPDHLDRHGGMDGYVSAKRRIFNAQNMDDASVVGIDDEPSAAIAKALVDKGRRVVPISVKTAPEGGVYVRDFMLFDDMDGHAEPVFDLRRAVNLPGVHNAQNAAAAYAAARLAGVVSEDIVEGLLSFAGLAHRQEAIATIEGVRFVNDSKATNADAARWALGCYDQVYWIAGGVAKSGGITELAPYFPRVAKAYLIGEAAAGFSDTLGSVPHVMAGDLASAVEAAFADAKPGSVVLLSPAAASFDQYSGFEARGDHFRRLVLQLARAEVSI
jgi:UDP-N-acetylmuramoylalanine--D-glutamate ligase